MQTNWQNWCRLCAKRDFTDGDAVYKMETLKDQLEVVSKYLLISLVPLEGIQSSICGECSTFLTKVEHFSDQCVRTDQMFNELLKAENISDDDLESIRFKYGIDAEEIKYSIILTEFENDRDKKEIVPPLDTFSDPLEVDLKEPVSEEPMKPSKKRGRPKKLEKDKEEISFTASCSDREIDSDKSISKEEPEEPIRARRKRGRPKKSERVENSLQLNEKPEEPTSYCSENEPEDTQSDEDSQGESNRTSSEKDKPRSCEICSKTFSRWASMRRHIVETHKMGELPYACSQCPRRFYTKSKMKLHETVHLPDEVKKIHPCPQCGKKFRTVENMKAHAFFMHNSNEKYICEECGKSFARKGSLTVHRVTHSLDRPFKCTMCPKTFKDRPTFKLHTEIHRGKRFKCPHCDVMANSKNSLRGHMVMHSDVKKYKCNYCGNEYKRANALKNHLILHTGARPFECEFCGKTFNNGSNCRNHKKKEHPIELAAVDASKIPRRVAYIPKEEQPPHEPQEPPKTD